MVNQKVFLDWEINKEYAGRLIFELFNDVVPKTSENFKSLCTGEKGQDESTGNNLTYKNSISHRIIKGFMIQFGDITNGNGTGGLSVYGGKFDDENFSLNHNKRGLLSMANAGPNTNGSQVFVTFCPCPHLDGKHVVFGELVKGKGLLRRLENVPTGENDFPQVDVRIINSGELKEGEDDGVQDLKEGEYEDYPEDDDSNTEEPSVAFEISKNIKDAGSQAFKQGDIVNALKLWEKSLRYLDVHPVLPDDTNKDLKVNYNTIRVQLNLNLSISSLKLNKNSQAESYATKAIRVPPLNPNEIVKGLYRRSLSKSNRNNFDDALSDLNSALKIKPNDDVILNQINVLNKKLDNFKSKQKQIYAKMFE